ncbi:hypothetical protein TKK_0009110 [Trichogramma kaykai]|uniref:MPN domain-containing protein n=1 Tax=Trichogramma kaykai TaxID=54128 RepID=A0ABD2X3X2_9HYME
MEVDSKEAMDSSNDVSIVEDSVTDIKLEPKKEIVHPPPKVRVPVKHSNLGIRSHAMDMSTMVELTSFNTLGKIQPFLVTVSASAAVLIDLHCHLTDKEVCGYLGGHWDINAHNLSILGAFPCRYAGKDKSAAAAVEAEISKAMEWKRMTLVGWYHSHPKSHASPSLRDVDAQLDYQIKMKGPSDNVYTPCVGLICSPYNTDSNCYDSNFNIFWSMPPPENRPHEYPRPMLLSYTLSQEQYISQDALEEMKKCIEYYRLEGGIDFTTKFNGNITYLERLKNSLVPKLPGRNNRSNGTYWELIKEMLAPGFDDGSEPSYANLKFPLMNDTIMPPSSVTTPFIPPALSAVQKACLQADAENNHRDSPSLKSSHIISTAETMPTFRAGELTVSVKNTKSDYDYSPTDFTKIDSMKGRNDYSASDLSQQMKFSDLSKLASFSPAELAKLTGFTLSEFTKAASSSTYMRNLTNLFSPMGKLDQTTIEATEKRSSELSDLSSPFKPPQASSPGSPKETHKATVEDYSDKSKKYSEPKDASSSYAASEDLSKTGDTLDMSTKKHQADESSGETLDLSKDRQS